MKWSGKIIGAILGYLLAGPFGLIIGLLIGHFFDMGRTKAGFYTANELYQAQNAFFEAVFLVMGHLAKADGRVTEQEIAAARQIMTQMGLTLSQKRRAIELFSQGKQLDFNLNASLLRLKQACHNYKNLLRMFIEIELQVAYAKGFLDVAERHILEYICQQLGFEVIDFRQFEDCFRAEQSYQRYQYQSRQRGYDPQQHLSDAYRILSIPSSANDAEVKKAYRRLMSQHHPDKLVSKGLPEEMLKIATQKTQEIKAAYDQICKARGIK